VRVLSPFSRRRGAGSSRFIVDSHHCGHVASAGPASRLGANMNREPLLAVAVVSLLFASTAAQAENALKFFADAAGTDCSLDYTTAGLVSTHVIVTGTTPSAAIQFSAVTPECWTGVLWIGDNFATPGIRLGSTQDPGLGLQVTFGGCEPMPFYAGYISHFVTDVSASCCPYMPGPADIRPLVRIIATAECTVYPLTILGIAEMQGVGLVVNPTRECPCELPVPAAESTWGRVKALYR